MRNDMLDHERPPKQAKNLVDLCGYYFFCQQKAEFL